MRLLLPILYIILGATASHVFRTSKLLNRYEASILKEVKMSYLAGCGQGLIKGLEFDQDKFADQKEFCQKVAERYTKTYKKFSNILNEKDKKIKGKKL